MMITATVKAESFLNFDYAQACKVLLPAGDNTTLVLVGCGGTGSWLAPAVARVARVMMDKLGHQVRVVFVDPDRVEEKNVYRQNFCQAEVGLNKAEALAFRYGLAWGLEITALAAPFSPASIDVGYGQLVVVIGCVDNAKARRAISKIVEQKSRLWWLDCGNEKDSGQVLLGCGGKAPEDPFQLPGFCTWLPSPGRVAEELVDLTPQPPSLKGKGERLERMSCAELAMFEAQGLAINQRVASEAADYLVRLLVTKDLVKMGTWLDLAAGSARSRYVTREEVMGFAGKMKF